MEHYFELPVNCEGQEQNFKGRLVTFGYDYKFYIVVAGEEIVFERDEHGYFHTISNPIRTPDRNNTILLEAIVRSLQQLPLR
ncbi:hypothetical protein [Pinibacter aurantiacus]|uniref:Uncharacterized protein n=1 Tax=Pinibacter aurantiacus TaxID=2851599 RepID=A0A9E2SA54_9BACT|nr:hypothetical protein [Pinibacter aurantiacus]MBV4358766.1 hypothetical protein [Pinibacter aurantiacus]